VNYPNRFVNLQLVAVSLCSGIVVRCTAVNVEVLLSSSFEGVAAKLYFSVLKLVFELYRGADRSLVRPTSRCILFDGENISFDANLVI
jgi:hypothetical protein